MIIDCHGHYTTTPPGVAAYREAQKEILKRDPDHVFEKGDVVVSDDEIRESILSNQLRLQRDRGRRPRGPSQVFSLTDVQSR